MFLKVCALYMIFASAFTAEIDSPCTTPNSENGICIPVNSCRPIKQAITYLDPEALEFARNSQCGYDNGPLVCCGSVGRVTSLSSLTERTTLPSLPVFIPSIATPIDNSFLPDRSLCGLHITENGTKGGKPTEITEFPWTALLKYTKDDGTLGGFNCSGTLINTRYVLTAAQCLNIPGFNLTEVRLGEWKLATKDCIKNVDEEDDCKDPVMDLMIVEKVSHPFFNNRSGNNNIALLRLEKKVNYNDYIRPICLPPSEYLPPPAGTRMKISGWSIIRTGLRSNVKWKADIPMVGMENCDKVYPNYTRLYPNKACAGGKKRKNLCNGDSGGPLMRTYEKEDETDEQQWFQEGIVHKMVGCEEKRYIGLYTRVSKYLHWILNNLKQS